MIILIVLKIYAGTIAIFDAGSTGTRLNIYDFKNYEIVSFTSADEPGGLDKFDENEIRRILYKLINDTGLSNRLSGVNSNRNKTELENRSETFYQIGGNKREEIRHEDYRIKNNEIDKNDDKKSIKFAFYGTAGFRELPKKSQKSKMKIIKKILSAFELVENYILSGDEEGKYTMEAFEYLNNDKSNFSLIDMGGKSLQVASKVNNSIYIESFELGILKRRCDSRNINMMNFNYDNNKKNNSQTPLFNYDSFTEEDLLINKDKPVRKIFNGNSTSIASKKHSDTMKNNINYKNRSTDHNDHESIHFDQNNDKISNQVKRFEIENNDCVEKSLNNQNFNLVKNYLRNSKIYLLSVFYDVLSKFGKFNTIHKIEQYYDVECYNKSEECKDIDYIIKILKKLGIGQNQNFQNIKFINGKNLTWSLGKALEIEKKFQKKKQGK